MDKKIKKVLGIIVVLFFAFWRFNSVFAYEGVYDCKKSFKYDVYLTSVTINEGVTKIDDDFFYGCTSLKSITIPNSVKVLAVGHLKVVQA